MGTTTPYGEHSDSHWHLHHGRNRVYARAIPAPFSSGVSGSANAAGHVLDGAGDGDLSVKDRALLKHFQARMPHGLGVPDVKPDTDP
jgi:hypothetical protein